MDSEFCYEFCVNGFTAEQAEELMNAIVAKVEEVGGAYLGGGYAETVEATTDES